MSELSPPARAVLEAVTWKKYDVPPEGLPAFAEEMAPLLAAALRAAADYDPPDNPHAVYDMGWYAGMEFIQSIADELETK